LAVFAILLVLATVLPAPVSGQFIVLDPANLYQQILQYAQMLVEYYQQYEQLVQEVQQLLRLVEQIELMLEALDALEEMVVDNPGRALLEVRVLLAHLGGIVYVTDEMLRRFDHVFSVEPAFDLPFQERERTEQALRTMRTLLASAGEAARASEESSHALGELSAQLHSAEGNLEALQAVGALTTQVATETTRLHETTLAVLNAQGVYSAYELSSREQGRRTFMDWIERGAASRPAEPPRSFSVVPPAFGER
jgi:P-type conjugative transfer protein TrbJ